MVTSEGLADVSPAVLTARLDRIPTLTRKHIGLVALLISLFVFDIVDLSALSFVAPALREQWGLTLEELGLLTSTAFIGMFLGGLIGGRLADRFGRKPILLVGVVLFSLASIASAFAPNAEVLGVLRFILGFGLQMTTGAVLVIVSESFPKAFRGRVMASVLGISLVGTPLIALVALALVPRGMWSGVFCIGGLGLVPALLAIKLLPESPRWLALNGRVAEADAQLRIYEAEYTAKHGILPVLQVQSAVPLVDSMSTVVDILKPKLIRRTVVATLVFCGFILINYGFSTWLPIILVERGYPQSDALTFSFALSFAYMAGALLSTLFIDRVERKFTIATAIGLAAICYLTVGLIDSVPVLLVAGFAANMLTQVVLATIYSYVPELFPVQVRGIGAGFANGTARFAGIFSGIIVAAVLAAFAVEGVFVYLALVALAMAAIVLFGPRTGVRDAHRAQRAAKEVVHSETAGTALEV